MNEKPEALRLADALELPIHESAYYRQPAAAELRRLHEEIGDWDRVCDQHLRHIDKLKKRMKKVEALNQELLEALKVLLPGAESMGWDTDKARAALAKAEGQA